MTQAETVVRHRHLVTVKEALAYGRMGRELLYMLIKSGQIKAYKRGARTLVDLNSIDDYNDNLPEMER